MKKLINLFIINFMILLSISTIAISQENKSMTSNELYLLGCKYLNGTDNKKVDCNKAYSLLKESADMGNVDAMYQLGASSNSGYGINDFSFASDMLMKAAKKGHIEASYLLLSMHVSSGYDYVKTKNLLRDNCILLAENGDAKAQFYLSKYYHELDLQKDTFKWCKLSAENGYLKAQEDLVNYYDNGYGVEKNSKEAKKWNDLIINRLKENKSDAYYQFELSKAYNETLVTDKWAKLSIKQGYFPAFLYYMTFDSCDTELIQPVNDKNVFNQIVVFANKGYPIAQDTLGQYYLNGIIVKKDYKEAVKWFKAAGRQFNKHAIYSLANCYYKGYGVKQDYEEATKLLLSFPSLNSSDYTFDDIYSTIINKSYGENDELLFSVELNKNLLGQVYDVIDKDDVIELDETTNTQDIEIKPISLIKVLSIMIKNNDYEAMYYLGHCYLKGIEVEKNEKKAFEILNVAASHGNENAQTTLGLCYYYGIGTEINYNKAYTYFMLVFNDGEDVIDINTVSFYYIGECYYYGRGVKKNMKKAFEVWKDLIAYQYYSCH